MDFTRTDCIKSYFELVALVNKGNRVVNEQTHASFFIDEGNLFIGIDKNQKFYLCKHKEYWLRGNSKHTELEAFICKYLNTLKIKSGPVDDLIKRELFKLPG